MAGPPVPGFDVAAAAPAPQREPEPAAASLFGNRLPSARRYADLLCDAGVARGLVGPREAARVWSRHLLNCAVLSELIEPSARIVDVGSGSGLPGLVLAIRRPDVTVVLVEPLLRRVRFLDEAVAELGLGGQVQVVRGRAEDPGVRSALADATGGGADVVTARAVAPLGRLVGWCLPLLAPGGRLLLVKGATAPDEVDAARSALARAGAGAVRVLFCGAGTVDPPVTVVSVMPRAARGPKGRMG